MSGIKQQGGFESLLLLLKDINSSIIMVWTISTVVQHSNLNKEYSVSYNLIPEFEINWNGVANKTHNCNSN